MTAYLTYKKACVELISRFRTLWPAGFPRVAYQNTTMTPEPTSQETWVEFGLVFGESNLTRRKNIDGDNRIDRHHGMVRIRIHAPLGSFIGATQDLVGIVGKIYSRNWGIEHLFIAGPPRQSTGGKEGVHFVTNVDVPFYFDAYSEEVDLASMTSTLAAALAGSPLLN